jgi:hypothetical protein
MSKYFRVILIGGDENLVEKQHWQLVLGIASTAVREGQSMETI